MINIKNTNLTIKNGAYILDFCPSGNSYGKRITIICYDAKKCLKKYKDWYLFGTPLKYIEGDGFMALRKSMEPKTRNKQKILISNAMYHINKASEEGTIQTEM